MPVLDNSGQPVADRFITLEDDATLPASGAVIVSLARLQADPTLLDGPLTVGVALPVGATLEPIIAWLPRLALVAVSFPIFRDGRAFTLARELREHHHYAGEIRATGHVLPDQYVFLVRVGVSTVQLADGADIALWAAALHRQSHPEQPATERALPFLRRVAMPFDLAG